MKHKQTIPFLTITLFLTVITLFLLSLYSTTHWALLTNGYKAHAVAETSVLPADQKAVLMSSTQGIVLAGRSLLWKLGAYKITGLLALVISLVAVFKGKGIRRFIPLPFGLISGLLALITM